jgi:hypothetical protein
MIRKPETDDGKKRQTMIHKDDAHHLPAYGILYVKFKNTLEYLEQLLVHYVQKKNRLLGSLTKNGIY